MEAKQSLAGTYRRIPRPTALKLSLANLPYIGLEYIIYDLNDKTEVKQGYLHGSLELNLGSTEKDYFVLVTPFRT